MASSGGGGCVWPWHRHLMGTGQSTTHLPPVPKRDFTSHVTTVSRSLAVDWPPGLAWAWGPRLPSPRMS